MDTIRKALAVAVKEIQVFAKDRVWMITMLAVPLAVGAMNSAMQGDGSGDFHLPVIAVNQDAGAYGESIAEILANIEQIDLAESDSPATAEEQVRTGQVLAAVIIPADFTQRIDDYQPTEITVILDPAQAEYGRIISTIMGEIAGALAIQGEIRYGIKEVLADTSPEAMVDPALARAAQAQVEGVLFTQLQRMEKDAPIEVQKETLEGKQVLVWDNIFSIILPAWTVMFAFFIVPALSTQLLKEKEAGTLRRLVAAPLPRSALIGGKALAFLLIVLLQVVVLFSIGAIFMDMPLGESPLALILTTLALGLTATTLGMMIATLARSISQADSIGLLIVFVLGFLSGAMSPQNPPYRGEGLMATVSSLIPQAQAQWAYQTVMFQNGGVADILPQLAYLFGLSLVFFVIAVWRFRYES